METVLDTLREGVLVLSHDGAIEYANASAVRLLGVSQEDVNGAELRRLSPDIALALELPETVGALTRELEVRYPEPRLLNLHLTRVGEQQGAERARRVAVLSDVTKERVQTEDRVESERIDSIVSLAAGVAHEVGNPLNAIGIHLQLLQREAAKLGDSPAAEKVRKAAEVKKVSAAPVAAKGEPSLEVQSHIKQAFSYVSNAKNAREVSIRDENIENAVKEFSLAIQKDASYAEAYSNRAVAYMLQRKFNKADEDLRKARDLNPDSPSVRYNFASLYSLRGDIDLALDEIDAALDDLVAVVRADVVYVLRQARIMTTVCSRTSCWRSSGWGVTPR